MNPALTNVTRDAPAANVSDRASDLYLYSTAGGAALIVLVLLLVALVLLCDLSVGVAMSHARNTNFSTKLFTCMTLACDVVFVVYIFTIYAIRTLYGYDVYVNSILTFFTRIVMAMSWISVTMLLVDKVICLYYPNTYLKNASTKRVSTITLLTYVGVVTIMIVATFIVIPLFTRRDVTIDSVQEDGPILTWILGGCLFTDIGSYAAICRLWNRHVKRISHCKVSTSSQLRAFSTSRTVIVIFFVFLVVHAPLFLILLYQKLTTSYSNALRYAALVAMLIVCCTNPMLYAWRFRECRYLLLAALARAFPAVQHRAEAMRLEVYNVVISSKSDQTRHVQQPSSTVHMP